MTAQPVEPLDELYAWPATPVLDPNQAAALLGARLQAAYDDLEAQRLRIATAATAGQSALVTSWLEDFQAGIQRLLAVSGDNVRAFLQQHLGYRYQQGAQDAAADDQMTWTVAHTAALTSLAIDTYSDFLARALEAARVSEVFVRVVREASSEEIPKIAAGGRTARQVAAQLERKLVGRYGIDHVTYRDGSRVQVRVYAEMVARTKSGVAYNSGSLNQWNQEGVAYVEVFDGAACGWRSHDDPDKANATVRPVTEAARYMLSHPNCRRGFGARPDVTTDAEAKAAKPSTTAEQRADQAAWEQQIARPQQSRSRAAQTRRARQEAQRIARLRGVRDPVQVGALIDEALQRRGLI